VPAPAAPGTSSEVGATEQRVFRLANAAPSETADQLAQLFPAPSASNSGSQAPTTQFSFFRGGMSGQGGDTGTAANGSDRKEKMGSVQAVPDPRTSSVTVTAPKTLMPQIGDMITELDSAKGRKEVAGYFDLQNADPQDVYNNLQDLFQRNSVRPQNNNQNAQLGQNNPLTQPLKSNTQPTTQGATSTIGGSGGAVVAPPPSGPQELAAKEELSFDQIERLPSSQTAPVFKGTPKDALAVGDAPVVGQLFGNTPGAKEDGVNANLGAPTAPQSLAWGGVEAGVYVGSATNYVTANTFGLTQALTSPLTTTTISGYVDTSAQWNFGTGNANVGSLGRTYPNNTTIGGAFYSLDPENRRVVNDGDADKATAQQRSPIVLPQAQPETSPALKDGSGKDVQLFAAANQLGVAPEDTRKQAGEDAAKTQPYFEAKRSLEELQRFRQILDAKIASEKIDVDLPKTMMVEIADKAVPASSPSSTLWDKIRGKGGEFKSTARIKFERDQSDISGMAERGFTTGFDPYFIQTESEAIQSDAVLGKVAEDLNLKEAWAEKKGAGGKLTTVETVQLLKQSLDLRPVKNTGLLEIGVKSDKPEEAARIANAVAEEYKARRLEQRTQLAKAGAKALEERFAEQEQKVREAQKKVDDLRVRLNISDGMAAGEGAKKDSAEELPLGALDLQQGKPEQILDLYGKLVNRQVLRPTTLPAPTISFSTKTPLTKQEAVQALQGALALNGIALVNVGDTFVKAMPEAQGGTAGGRLDTNSTAGLPESAQYVTRVVQLQHVKPSEMVPVLQPFVKLPNATLPIDSSRILVLHDAPENVKRMSELIAKVDVATPAEYVSEVIPIKHGKASDIANVLNSLSSKGGGTSVGGGQDDSAPKVASKPAAPAPIPQPEVQTIENAFSTFSLNVSDVSFKLAAASLEKGVMPEPATVRSEEFINAFDYRDPEPPTGVPVAFAWERAQYPFAQNRDLLRFSIKTATQGRQPGRPLNLVLLLDNSGSMERADRVRIIREALRVLAGQLQPQDKFSVVTFSRTAHLWVDGVPGDQAAKVAEEVSGLTPQGGTNLEDAMNLAYQTALRHYLANGVNRVVLLTDGAANLGNVDPEALKQKIEANRKQGVALDCFGIGWEGYNDDLLEVLSRNGDGRYAFLNSPEEVGDEFAAKLAGALQVAASDVKVQVEFNPARVTAYRQLGYAKYQLTKEQFRDNTVNAAQIGAAEAGNALYTVEVNPAGTGPLCTVRVRFRIPGTADYREHAWDVPFNGNAVALEQASPAMRLAATGSALSEWLASSPYATEVTPDRLLGYLSGVPEVYGADARPKKLEWMIRQAKSIAGK
jgi:secreted protein with Ig-like and vWFA domain